MKNAIIRRIKLDKPNTQSELIVAALDKLLSKREREILEYRLPWTQEEVGIKFGLSKERVRAIEARVMEKVTNYLNEHGSW